MSGGRRRDRGDGEFADLVSGSVRPLRERDKLRPDPAPAAEPGPVAEPPPRFVVEREEGFVQARREDVSRRRLADLRAGRTRVDREIDLHGLGAREARRALLAALEQARQEGLRCVLVIHGAGRHSADAPVLRESLPGWVLEGPLAREVLALVSAPRRQGGPGATLVLLRRSG